MAASLQELNAKIVAIGAAVDADVEQDLKVIEAIEALIKKIEDSGTTSFDAEVTALEAASGKLTGDNAAVQAAIDKAVPPTTPPTTPPTV